MKVFDKWGFDEDGYNRDGYNKMGYDREGYNKLGFDIHGYNKQGINQKTLRDREGYDVEGYDVDGFDRNGYDKDGYNEYGFDQFGYDRKGYDKWGFDRNGIDSSGYDLTGYNKDGFNILGYDKNGFDNKGIHRDGFSINDFDEDGYHIYTGFNLQGYNRDGFNINGLDKEGFDSDGYNLEGFDKEGYDRSGYNKSGFNRRGYNIHGLDADGYDKNGYDKDGYDKDGRDREGYDRNGYDADGYDRYGYDNKGKKKRFSIRDLKPGMTIYHKNLGAGVIKRFEKEGNDEYIVLTYPPSKKECLYMFPGAFTGKGYNNGEVFLYLDKPGKLQRKEESYVISEDEKEKKWYSDLVRYLRGDFLSKEIVKVKKNFKPQVIDYIDTDGFIKSKEFGQTIDDLIDKVDTKVENIVENPYFSHIDYKDNSNLYIGKKEIPGYITDWADPKASLYYQYQMYIGIEMTGLKLVREIDFGFKKYMGYRDLYNAILPNNDKTIKYADERLMKIIETNQSEKKVHDIIESIQKNQYSIITQDKNDNLLVLGCAGSGKTMILMHRIRYIKYNNPKLNLSNISVISPTDILEKQNRELANILDIGSINQTTMVNLYRNISDKLIEEYYCEPNMFENSYMVPSIGELSLYDESVLDEILFRINRILKLKTVESSTYRYVQNKKLNEQKAEYQKKSESFRDFQHSLSIYRRAKAELVKYGENVFNRVLKRFEQAEKEIEKITNDIILIYLIYTKVGHVLDESSDGLSKNYDGFLKNTKYLASFIDLEELLVYLKKNDVECASISNFIQLLCSFEFVDNDKEITEGIISGARIELIESTRTQLREYFEYLKNRRQSLLEIPRKLEIIKFLKDNKMIKKQGKVSRVSAEQLLSVGNDICTFFDEMHWQSGKSDPFIYFDEYEDILLEQKRLKEFEQGEDKWRYLQDIIFEQISVKKYNGKYAIDYAQNFAICYLLANISESKDLNKQYFFIDEFQDFSNSELKFLIEYMPNSTFDFFGDFQQCINPKGIASLKDFKSDSFDLKKFTINENYRNARNITEYINDKFNLSIIGIGLKGVFEEYDTIKAIPMDEGDRVAVIVEDGFDGEVNIPGEKVYYYNKENEIYRDSYNVIPISQAKGLEFEKVIVLTKGMSRNQLYVAFTRAINTLIVVNG